MQSEGGTPQPLLKAEEGQAAPEPNPEPMYAEGPEARGVHARHMLDVLRDTVYRSQMRCLVLWLSV